MAALKRGNGHFECVGTMGGNLLITRRESMQFVVTLSGHLRDKKRGLTGFCNCEHIEML